MGLGIDELQIDEEYGLFYVHRDNGGDGYWNKYHIKSDSDFLDFLKGYEDSDMSIIYLHPDAPATEKYGNKF